ncbi:hypothetical protein QBC32DRAFT_226994 [Pseudoneurospora amorphoporcata]|uniref:ABC transporter domain-containing protein n=1 Tax=Pseudoneurospora amorphoporcata TaxID=241081 RepID=A0AAN6P3C1_9PEZI|nr:hypothetical protein QBC32DRAFT_226994 [Pseudoneurospora amorphoporcata]
MAIISQTWTLTRKNLLIVLHRHTTATVIRAFVLPVIIVAFLSFAKNLFVPYAVFGISHVHPVRSLADGLQASSGTGRNTVAFVNNGLRGGEIDRVIEELATIVRDAGKNASIAESEQELVLTCRASLRGVTPCYGAVVFHSSPDEGPGGIWNYTLRADSALGTGKINVDKDDNDAQVYMLPLQRAVDTAITRNGRYKLPERQDEFPFTSLTKEERADRVRQLYQKTIYNVLGVTFLISVIGVCYHLVGFMASERETDMSTLVEAMMFTKRTWEGQAARLLSYHLGFTILYLPGYVVSSIIMWAAVFKTSSIGILIIYHVLAGLSLASFSILGAAFFKKAQLSGISIVILYILLGVIAQIVTAPKTATVVVLSLLFMPCNYVYFISYLARFEAKEMATNLGKSAPESPSQVAGIVLWIFLIVQIFVYPILGAMIERYLHGTTSSTRNIIYGENSELGPDNAVQLDGFTKIYRPGALRNMFSFLSKPREPVVAVNGLTLTARRGQILALLGANGSGKSTTLDTIAGINKLSSGNITIDGTGGLGIAPQKNVLWDELTVEEHLRIFNRLKSPSQLATKEEILGLIRGVDLAQKINARSGTLSGGQKRKLQLGMMLTGGSAVCCVDEVSSGIDPLSRRKIWDILLAERGRRTMILTTHFLDEADLLADHIAIMSKGTLRAEGSSVELKNRMGGGYRIHLNNAKYITNSPDVSGVQKKVSPEEITYIASSSASAASVIKRLEAAGISDYRFSGPTIEDVFLQLAEEIRAEDGPRLDQFQSTDAVIAARRSTEKQSSNEIVNDAPVDDTTKPGLNLLSGQRIGYLKQGVVLFRKRMTILKRNWFPIFAVFLIPIIASGLVTLFVKGKDPVGCNPADQSSRRVAMNLFASDFDLYMVAGPSDKFSTNNLASLFAPIYMAAQGNATSSGMNPLSLFKDITLVDTLDEFNSAVVQYRKDITPAAIWLGDDSSVPTMGYKSNTLELFSAWFGLWITDMVLSNTTIASQLVNFDIPFTPDTGKSLQMLVYLGLALCAAPGFFALYPNLERRRNVRGLQYSNGVRPLPLWLAYITFDFLIVLVSSAICTALLAGLASVWYHVGYLFIVLMLYGLASILLAYVISLFCNNQLSAYAFTAGGQVVMFLIYLIAYMCTITYGPVDKVDDLLVMVHFVVAIFAPVGSLTRALFIVLNLFSTACDGDDLASYPGGILQYGGPILYLILQSIILFIILVWIDAGNPGSTLKQLFKRKPATAPPTAAQEAAGISDEEVAHELVRVKSSANSTGAAGANNTDGLQVVNLTKTFGRNTAVDNVTFGVPHGQVFALLGPNGAGKSTTISVIRGDIKPDFNSGGDVFVEQSSVTRSLAAARSNLGVCPQFDAVDTMTVLEHLCFYARVRGIPASGIEYNVEQVIRAVGLTQFRDRMALALSGGNRRKLSLGIALMGNPTVVLLDEPSSGLDAAAKRIMWRTLAETVAGRSILLTTHSMEEADALAGRAGILAKRMLAMGSVDSLRKRFGDTLHVHLVCRGAPRTSDSQINQIHSWIESTFGSQAELEGKTYHGQMRFSVPAAVVLSLTSSISNQRSEKGMGAEEIRETETQQSTTSAIGKLVVLLEEQRERLGVEHFSVSPTTLDQVFLEVVGRHDVREEGYATEGEEKPKKGLKGLFKRK